MKYLNGLVKNLIGYLTVSISAKLELGRIADVVVLEDVAAVEFYRLDYKTIHFLLDILYKNLTIVRFFLNL